MSTFRCLLHVEFTVADADAEGARRHMRAVADVLASELSYIVAARDVEITEDGAEEVAR